MKIVLIKYVGILVGEWVLLCLFRNSSDVLAVKFGKYVRYVEVVELLKNSFHDAQTASVLQLHVENCKGLIKEDASH